ncbi:MAG: hypothetical protein Q9159_005135 [Coniocarpon cinnabarinum]
MAFQADSRLAPSSIPANTSRLRGPSPIREKFEHFRERVVGRVRSPSSSSTNSNTSEYVLSNAIFNVATTSAAIGGGEEFRTIYENESRLVREAPRPSRNVHDDTLRSPIQCLIDSESQSKRQSVGCSVTIISRDSFHTAQDGEIDGDSPDVCFPPPTRSNTASSRYPGAHTFVRQFSAFLARDDVDSNELFVDEGSHVVGDESSDQDDQSTLSDTDPDPDEPPLRNVLNIAVYRDDVATSPVQVRALLDTGNTGHNLMAERIALDTGRPMEAATAEYAEPPIVANGQPLEVLGLMRVRWYFNDSGFSSTTRSYDVNFQVIRGDVPFDVALCFKFLQEQHILRMASQFAMTLGGSSTSIWSGASTKEKRHPQAEEDRRRRDREKEARRAAEAKKRKEQRDSKK